MQRWTIATLVLLALPAHLAAQEAETQTARDERARAHFEAGRAEYGDSHYADALSEFESAYELSGRPELLYNMGQCLDRLRRDAAAIETFERYLAELPAAANRIEVETRLSVLRSVAVEAPAVSVAPEVLTTAPPAVHGGVETEWWFWTAIGGGAALIGAIVAIVVVSTSTTSTDPLYQGDVGPGGIVFALEGP